MVKKYLILAFLCILFFTGHGHSAEKNAELIIKEIGDTFSEDILLSSEVYRKRKYYLKYPEKFEAGPAKLFLFHSEPELTLKTILGELVFYQIPENKRSELIQVLYNTFRRYAYEWLNSNLNTSLNIKKIKLISKDYAVLIVERNMKIVPDLDLKLFISKTDSGWKVYDFGFWNFRYTEMKRGLYFRYAKNNDIDGLIDHLNKKNYKFFKKNINFYIITP